MSQLINFRATEQDVEMLEELEESFPHLSRAAIIRTALYELLQSKKAKGKRK